MYLNSSTLTRGMYIDLINLIWLHSHIVITVLFWLILEP